MNTYGTKPYTLAALLCAIVTLTACASPTNTIDIIRQTERSCPAEWRIDVSHMGRGESREVIDCRNGGVW